MDSKLKDKRLIDYLLPVLVWGLVFYSTWAFSHKLCYNQIYKNFKHESIAIGLICIICILDITLIIIWIQLIWIYGPGRQPKIPPFILIDNGIRNNFGSIEPTATASIPPPVFYECDINGYPIWCDTCKSLKIGRTHHSKRLGYCIPRFDHHCMWVGTVIGKSNYLLFTQFVFYFSCLLLIFWISIVSYIKRIVDYPHTGYKLDPNLIVILILSVPFSIMTLSLFLSHVYFTFMNRTSLEIINIKRNKKLNIKKFVCYLDKTSGNRYVIEMSPEDMANIWKKRSIWENFKEVLGNNFLFWFIPFDIRKRQVKQNNDPECIQSLDYILGFYNEAIGEDAKLLIEQKIINSNYLKTFRAFGDQYH
ncbi:hypothetical protein Kpol_1004p57 [Vanderwaltozyma polyspora DSM 70294]|uniref:Palmitoyltransferase n=1 Tax=Vanderwaltozyma polyspora (strain ATCC 22028 / DSM 70294 / BCRC 21397 / CBS 2163 / NBRC 10782 / NRRL Y-8283 / UCD 57-17) TaxID=436907 RepID=A7TJB1_VANPO|nr:uncharacterized protein Kpol_1004p57 [Vanderwaltozyma polyspora DSM 70294]EDO17680.1 hypothetical protein Kpol_1004p57 [Vanderwaltozyma polyspora DSM 70294]